MKEVINIALLLISLFTSFILQHNPRLCGLRNAAFQANETFTRKVFYNTLGVYVGVGDATFTPSLEKFNGKTLYHCVGEEKSYPFFDKFFRACDRYESLADTATILPVKFVHNVGEAGYKIYNNLTFNQEAATVISTKEVFKTLRCVKIL